MDALGAFVTKYSGTMDVTKVQYALAVRLARGNKYEEAAALFDSLRATSRGVRMRELAALYKAAFASERSSHERLEAKYRFAEFLSRNSVGIYFNDRLWMGFQRYVFTASQDSGLTRSERDALIAAERKLKDEQEEYWRAYQILRDVVREAGATDLGRKAAQLAIRCLRRISVERFGREEEIRRGDIELSSWLLRN
jgi:hypothetical protein